MMFINCLSHRHFSSQSPIIAHHIYIYKQIHTSHNFKKKSFNLYKVLHLSQSICVVVMMVVVGGQMKLKPETAPVVPWPSSGCDLAHMSSSPTTHTNQHIWLLGPLLLPLPPQHQPTTAGLKMSSCQGRERGSGGSHHYSIQSPPVMQSVKSGRSMKGAGLCTCTVYSPWSPGIPTPVQLY